MAPLGKYLKEQLLPEDPMDWVIMLVMVFIVVGGLVMLIIMFSSGMI